MTVTPERASVVLQAPIEYNGIPVIGRVVMGVSGSIALVADYLPGSHEELGKEVTGWTGIETQVIRKINTLAISGIPFEDPQKTR